MIKAQNFFFFAEVSPRILVDFRRYDDKMILNFCHENDKFKEDVLSIEITSKLVETSNTTRRDHFVSYELTQFPNKVIKQSKSDPLPADLVWGVVVAIVNDSFAN